MGLDNSPIWQNQSFHLTFVYGNGTMAIYTNGVVHNSNSSVIGRADEIVTPLTWIGRSPVRRSYT